MKSTALCEIAADISKEELERREIRQVALPAGAPSPISATARSEGRDEPGHYKRRRAYNALTIDSVIFFASPSSIIVLSR